MGFSRQDYWSGLPCTPPGDLLYQEIKLTLFDILQWQAGSLPLASLGKQTHHWSEVLCFGLWMWNRALVKNLLAYELDLINRFILIKFTKVGICKSRCIPLTCYCLYDKILLSIQKPSFGYPKNASHLWSLPCPHVQLSIMVDTCTWHLKSTSHTNWPLFVSVYSTTWALWDLNSAFTKYHVQQSTWPIMGTPQMTLVLKSTYLLYK